MQIARLEMHDDLDGWRVRRGILFADRPAPLEGPFVETQPPTITINPPGTTFGTTTFSTTTIGTTTFGTTTSGMTTSSGYLSWPAGKGGFTIVL